MKLRATICLGVFVLAMTFPYFPVRGDDSGWTSVGDGIEYQRYVMPGPIQAYVARMDRANKNAFLESSIATGEFSTGKETVRGMATRYDEALNFWGGTWGGRNHVVVAINGDYVDKRSGEPEKGQIQSGWYAKRYNDYQGESGFVWTLDRDAFIGQCIANPPKKQFISFSDPSIIQRVNGLNAPRGKNELIIYTPQFNAYTPTDNSGVEVVIQLGQPLLISPTPGSVLGVVISISDGKGGTEIPFDSVVLSASGNARETLLSNIHEGDAIGFSQEITSFDSDCKTPLPVDWTGAYASVGGNVTVLRDGQVQHDDEAGSLVRSPRTAIAYNDQYIYFVVVDGRQPSLSIGMTNDELGAFIRDELDASWGISQDGGGSSTMVINGEVVNTPSDQCYKLYMPDVENPIPPTSSIERIKMISNPVPLLQSGLCERQVANGMMMVVQQPAEQSGTFIPGMVVYTTDTTEVRLGPGTNYAVTARVPAAIAGMIESNANGLEGVLAKNAFWWKVSFGDLTGWVRESSLAAQVVAPSLQEPNCDHPTRALRDRVCLEK